MKKILLTGTCVLLLVCCVAAFAACGSAQKEIINAYDVAVENGFEGTETEWLDSLKGKDGQDGQNGTNGQNGLNGKDGKDNTLGVADYYQAAVDAGYEGTMLDFLKEYLSVEIAPDNSATIAKNLLSSVSVVARFSLRGTDFWGRQINTTGASAGSGVFYRIDRENGDALVITNYHVVYNQASTTENHVSDDVSVYLYGAMTNDQAIPATFLGGSMSYDIAVLKIENSDALKTASATEVTFADSNDVTVGQEAIAIGNANGDGISATSGVVSVDSETIQLYLSDDTTIGSFRVLRVDTAINHGNSGGGLFDAEGKLIGIVNAKDVEDDVENMGYALPSNVVKYVTENILYYAERGQSEGVKKCMLGVTVYENNAKGVYYADRGKTKIESDVTVLEQPATESSEEVKIEESALVYGKLQGGDVLKKFLIDKADDDEEGYTESYGITRSYIVVDLMLTMRVGDKVKIVFERENAETKQKETKEIELVMTEECITTVK